MKSMLRVLALVAVFVAAVPFTGCSDKDFVVVADNPLRVVYLSPNDGGTDVAIDTAIVAVFSEDVVAATVTDGNGFYIENIADPENPAKVAGTVTYDEVARSATFKPGTPLGYSSDYRVVLKKTILKKDSENSEGGTLAIEVNAKFRTIDPDDLTVVHTTPAAGAWGVPIMHDIRIVFSHPVAPASVVVGESFVVEDITDTTPVEIEPVEEGLSWNEESTILTFTAAAPFGYSRTIRVTLTSAIASPDASLADPTDDPLVGHLRNGYVLLYTTIDPPPLAIVAAGTGTGALPMPRTDTLVFTFSEGVAQASVREEETIIVEDVTGLADPLTDEAHGIIAGTVSFNAADAPTDLELIGDDNIVTFTPDASLPYGTIVRVVWPGSDDPTASVVKSDRATARGGQLPADAAYIFESEITPDLIVTGTFPGEAETGKPIDGSITITFNKPVDCATLVLGTSVTLAFDSTDPETPGAAIAATISPACLHGDTSVTIVPDAPVKYSRDVVVTLTDAVATIEASQANEHADPLMGHLRGGYIFHYSTMDPPPLGVVTIGTGSGHFTMPRTDTIIVGFSEGVRQASAVLGETVIVEDVTGLADPLNDTANGEIAGALTYNTDDAPTNAELIGDDIFMTFAPEEPFLYGTLVRVTIPASDDPTANVVKSDRATTRGGQHTLATVFLVEVERLEELRVIATSPAHDNRDVPHTATQITVTFNYAPDCTTINGTNIFVTYDDGTFVTDPVAPGGTVTGSWACTDGEATVTFTADEEFGYGRDFLVHLTSDVRDERAAGGSVNPNDPTQGYLVPPFSFGFGTEHLDKLYVISSNAAGSSSFDPDLPIIITFNQPAACATLTDANFFINKGTTSDPAQKLTAVIDCANPDSATVQLTPDDGDCGPEALCYDSDYTVTLEGGYTGVCSPDKTPGDESDDGCIASPEYIFSFHTAKQGEFVAVIYPPNGASGVSPSVQPTVTFSAAVNTASVETDLGADADGIVPNICLLPGVQYDCSDPSAVAVDIQWTIGDTLATLIPTATLTPDSDYTIVVSKDIEDIDGRTLTGFYTSTFHTGTAGLLIYVVVNDADDLNALDVVAYFREDVDVDSVNGGTFYVTYENEFGGTTAVPGNITWNAGCDLGTNAGCTVATFTPDMYALYSCGERSSDPQFSLPLNTEFTVHVSTYIRNANWDSDQLHVESLDGGNEFLHEFKTPPSISILGTKYQNAVVPLTNLSGADEVPVNAEFIIAFREKIDPASANGNTIMLEDDRGTDGSVTAASSQFTVAKIGTFVTGRDEGKLIELFGTEEQDGMYAIETVIDDHTVTLTGITFTETTTDLNWSRYWAPADLTFSVENDDSEIHIAHTKRLIHHSDYLGFHAAVTAGSNLVTIPTTADNYRVATYRDLGKYLFLYGLQSGNTVRALITGVDELANTLTTDTTFTNASTDVWWRISDDRDHHRLIIKGRTYRNTNEFLRAADGNPFAGLSRYTFITSPETHIRISPDSTMTNVLENPIVIFSRPIHRDSVSHDTLYLIQNGELNVSLTAMQSAQPTSLMVMPMPALVDSKTIPAYLYVTEGVWDYRGNPVIPTMKTWDEIGGAPATSAITPNVVLAVTPTTASAVKGDQHFAINWPAGGENDKFIMAPASINGDSIYLDQINKSGVDGSVLLDTHSFAVGTAWTFASGDEGKIIETSGSGTADNNGRRTIIAVVDDTHVLLDRTFAADEIDLAWALVDQIPFELYFVPEQAGNVAEIYPGRFIQHDAGAVRLTIRKDRIANLYTIASTDSDMVLNYTVETTAPTVLNAYGQNEVNAWINLSGATDLKATTLLTVAFNETVDPASFVMGGTVTLTDTGGTVIGATINATNTMVVIKPNAPLASTGNPYLLTIDGATDTAGNALAAPYTVSFSIEETAPTILSVNPADLDTEVSVNAPIRVRASEPISIATVTRSTTTTDGSFRVTRGTPPACGADAENDVFGCLALDSSSRRVTFVPLPNDLHDQTAYTLTIAGSIADLAGNTLGADFTSTFDTLGGDDAGPMPLCADIDLAGGQVIDLYFSEEIDNATIGEATIFIYEVESGVVLGGLFTIETVDGYPVVRFTATGSFVAGVEYGLIVTKGVMGDDGNPIVEEFRTFFTGTL